MDFVGDLKENMLMKLINKYPDKEFDWYGWSTVAEKYEKSINYSFFSSFLYDLDPCILELYTVIISIKSSVIS